MLTEFMQTIKQPTAGALVKIVSNSSNADGWDTYPGTHGYHTRVDVKIGLNTDYCLVVSSLGNYRRLLMSEGRLLWFYIDNLILIHSNS